MGRRRADGSHYNGIEMNKKDATKEILFPLVSIGQAGSLQRKFLQGGKIGLFKARERGQGRGERSLCGTTVRRKAVATVLEGILFAGSTQG